MDADSDVGGGTVTPQETATDTSTESTETSTGSESSTETVADPASQKVTQTQEQNAAFAELRRKSESRRETS